MSSQFSTKKEVSEYIKTLDRDSDFSFLTKIDQTLLTNSIKKHLVNLNGLTLKYFDEQDEKLCVLAVRENYEALEFVKNQTLKVIQEAFENQDQFESREAINLVKNPTYEICKLALEKSGLALEFIKNQTDELCKIAVEENGLALKFVKEQTPEICELALKQDGEALMWVENQTLELCELAMSNGQSYVVRGMINKKFLKHFPEDNSEDSK